MRPATAAEMERWDELVAAQGAAASVLQGSAFAEIKAATGWQPRYYLAGELPVMILGRRVIGLGNLLYVPGGPMVGSLAELANLLPELRALKGFLLQLEPELEAEPGELQKLAEKEGINLRRGIQPNTSTVVVNLEPSEAELLAGFHSKTRYNIRLAERKGVTVEAAELTEETMRLMYGLMASSQERGGYYMRPYRYFERAWRAYAAAGSGQLFLARYEDTVLAGAFVTYLGQKALYKDGGSMREHRETQPMSLLQWEAMRWLKGRGVTRYDLHGVPPVERIEDPTHPFAGLARFKLGFQPVVTTHVGVLEAPLNPRAYKVWGRVGERVYGALTYRLRGQSIY